MATTRNDLRDHLLAALQAAPELPAEDRVHLADSFLDDLEKQYQLVPRVEARSSRRAGAPAPRPRGPRGGHRAWWPFPGAIIAAMFLGWLLIASFFTAVHHPPVFLLVILLIVAFRFLGGGMRRRGYFS